MVLCSLYVLVVISIYTKLLHNDKLLPPLYPTLSGILDKFSLIIVCARLNKCFNQLKTFKQPITYCLCCECIVQVQTFYVLYKYLFNTILQMGQVNLGRIAHFTYIIRKELYYYFVLIKPIYGIVNKLFSFKLCVLFVVPLLVYTVYKCVLSQYKR